MRFSSVHRGQHDLQFVEFVPLRIGPLPFRDGQKLLLATAGGSWLLFSHGAIISPSLKICAIYLLHIATDAGQETKDVA